MPSKSEIDAGVIVADAKLLPLIKDLPFFVESQAETRFRSAEGQAGIRQLVTDVLVAAEKARASSAPPSATKPTEIG